MSIGLRKITIDVKRMNLYSKNYKKNLKQYEKANTTHLLLEFQIIIIIIMFKVEFIFIKVN